VISLIDSHCHIDLPVFDEDREATIKRALDAGIHAIIAIGHNPERWRTTGSLASQYPFILRTAGLHPNDASIWTADLYDRLDAELATGEPLAVGETGLDYFRDSAPAELQREAFASHIALARKYNLPIVIHQRAAEADVLDVLGSEGPVRGVLHCFSGDERFAKACLEMGLLLGIGGVATYPRSDDVRTALAAVSVDAVILETDAPYLAPQPWRGKRNEPVYVLAAAEQLATIHGVAVSEIAKRTTENAIKLFGHRLDLAVQAGSGNG
jgi:TatD DNase family protein